MSIKIAVSKGRVEKQTIKLLQKIGYVFDDLNSRKLIITDQTDAIQLIFVKASDVTLYVEKGFADLGIVGNDVIDEGNANLYQLLDMKFGACKLSIAGYSDLNLKEMKYLKIATKYEKQGYEYLKEKNMDGEIIKLNGSVELGPILGIGDCILDIVETGTTLKENNLVVLEDYKVISSRLIANRVFYKTKFEDIQILIENFKKYIGE